MKRCLSRGERAQRACDLEVTARKPGNVHPGAAFADLTLDDFLRSASAIREPLDHVARWGVGRTILRALIETQAVCASNSNLGVILLLTPLAAIEEDERLPAGIERVLGGLSVEDADFAYEAIRRARPAGLGRVSQADVQTPPVVNLRQAMSLAAERDLVARQYHNGYREVMETGLAALEEWLGVRGASLESAIIATHLRFMSRYPDSLIARKRGMAVAIESSQRAAAALESGQCRELDDWLRADAHHRNPGTSADLVAASLYLALREGIIDESAAIDPAAGCPWWGDEPTSTTRWRRNMAEPSYRVRVTKDHLVFSAGHFITFNGAHCERIHGHNWRVAVEVEGELDQNGYVFDFIRLLELSRAICLELDHRMLLPDGTGLIQLAEDGPNWRVSYEERFWSFPRDECVVLPIANTTTELIARWFAARLAAAITADGTAAPRVLRVEVEENFGQKARFERRRELE